MAQRTPWGYGFTIINDDGHLSQEEIDKIGEEDCNLAQARYNRSSFLDECIHVERLLGDIINYFFVGSVCSKSDIFTELITTQPYLSFREREKIVISLIKGHPEYFKNIKKTSDIDKFSRIIKKMVDTRNLVAHGELVFDLKDNTCKIAKYSLHLLEKEIEPFDYYFTDKWAPDVEFLLNFCLSCRWFLMTGEVLPTDEKYKVISGVLHDP